MSNLPDDWDAWDEERQARYAKLMNWLDGPAFIESLNRNLEGMKTLARPGISFTPEQKAQIRAMQDAGDTATAQQTILDQLNKELPPPKDD